MANELAALTEFTCNVFKHACFCLPWFCGHCGYGLGVENHEVVATVMKCLKKNRPLFFGSDAGLAKANRKLGKFYDNLIVEEDGGSNEAALWHFVRAWHHAWKNRACLQLRGHEARLMKYFHEVYCRNSLEHLPELVSMARVVSPYVVPLARSIVMPGGWSAEAEVKKNRGILHEYEERLFGGEQPSVERIAKVKKSNASAVKAYKEVLRDYQHAVQLRIGEIFDERCWYPTIDSASLHIVLKNEGLEEYLPYTFRGRVGVQPTGYPLTFYTYQGLELEKPPLNDVRMNVNYGVEEKDKDYGIHPVDDGTFYCQTRAVVGESEVKYYTLEYKRRARRMKYDTVATLEKSISRIRRRMLKHLRSDHRDTWVRALICLIIDSHCARIGNSVSARGEKKTYGLTTLMTKKHAEVTDDYIVLKYQGKHERPQKHRIRICKGKASGSGQSRDALVAQRLLELIAEGNTYLFTHADGKPFSPQSVNDYFTTDKPVSDRQFPAGGAGSPCTVHNMRNFHATRIFKEFAVRFAANRESATYEEVLTAYQGKNKTRKHRAVKGVLDVIAEKLGNTPAVCRRAYIDPREQLLFFKRWGYRPPDCLIRDVFVHERTDPYNTDIGLDPNAVQLPCGRRTCKIMGNFLPTAFSHIEMRRREESAVYRKKKASGSSTPH